MTETLVFDRSDRLRMRVNGPKAAEMVNGLVTNDVSAIAPGEGLYAAALTAKSKIVADLRIFRETESVFIDASAAAGPGWMDMVRKYINPRVAPYKDVSADVGDVGVYGPNATSITARVTGVDENVIKSLKLYSHVACTYGIVAKVPDLDMDGFEIFTAQVNDVKTKVVAAGARVGTPDDWEMLRIRSGRPEWGADMDDNTLPQEANMDELNAISYKKGCYIGQETVARIHFRGHVNKHLRKITFADNAAPERGAELLDHEGKVVGDVRSAMSGVGIGMIRREIPIGTQLSTANQILVTVG
jgi:folate-binding protein YgfZ